MLHVPILGPHQAIVAGAPSIGVLVLAVAAREAIMVAVRPFRSSALLTLSPVGHSGLFTGVKESFKNAGFGMDGVLRGPVCFLTCTMCTATVWA